MSSKWKNYSLAKDRKPLRQKSAKTTDCIIGIRPFSYLFKWKEELTTYDLFNKCFKLTFLTKNIYCSPTPQIKKRECKRILIIVNQQVLRLCTLIEKTEVKILSNPEFEGIWPLLINLKTKGIIWFGK